MFLAGVTVVDWSFGHTGPFAARILGDLGATVIRIEDPGAPDPLRAAPPLAGRQSALHAYLNAGKTILRLDPVADAERFVDLLAGATILVESQEGAGRRALIAELRAVLRDLTVVSVSAYGRSGPAADRPWSDLTVQHFAGLAHNQARPVKEPERTPPQPGAEREGPLAAGVAAAAAAVWGLLVAESGETAPHADLAVSEFYANVLFESLGEHGAGERSFDRRRKEFKGTEVAGGLIWILPCSDGWVMASPREQHQWDRWIELLGSPDWSRNPALCGDKLQRKRKWGELQALMAEWTRGRSRDEVFARAQAARVACFPVSRPDDILSNPQLGHRAFFDRLEVGGHVLAVPGLPFIATTSAGRRLARGNARTAPPPAGGEGA